MTLRSQLLTTSIFCIAFAGAAHAAEPATASAQAGTTVGEIVVTAQKRSESVSNVGMAITALSGVQLKTMGVNGVAGITRIDPSFVVLNSTYGNPVYSIRGIAFNNYSLAAAPAVSVYSDEIPYAYPPLSKGATYDLERVEVLKGPQGTLYGQSATAGAINYISAKPTKTLSAGVEGSYGSYNATNFNGYLSGPVTDTLAARLAFNVDEGGAWQKSTTRDAHLGNKDSQKARLIVDWKPTDRLSVEANLNGWLDRSDSLAGQFVTLAPQQPAYVSLFPFLTSARPPSSQQDGWADWQAGLHPRLDEKSLQGSVRVNYKFSDHLALTYLGSYQNYSQNDLIDNGGTATEANYIFHGQVHSLTQELRLAGDLWDGKLNWLAGLNYQQNLATDNQIYDLVGGSTIYGYVKSHLGTLPYYSFTNTLQDDSKATAAFADVTYKILDNLSVHAGARYTEQDINHGACSFGDANYTTSNNASEQASITAHPGTGPYIAALPGQCITEAANFQPEYVRGSLDQHNISWRVGADWKPIPGTLVYGSISQGYKAGSFPEQTLTNAYGMAPVVQESLLAYEAGVKTHLLENRVQLDGDIFYYDYRNKQLEGRQITPVGFGNLIVNVPKSYETGAELNLTVEPVKNLVFNIKETYLYSEITGNFSNFDGFGIATNFQGDSYAQAPRYSTLIDGQYSWDLSDKYSAFVGFNASYRTATPSQLGTKSFNSPPYFVASTYVKAYGLLGLRAGVLSSDGHWRVEAIANNVTNTYYWTEELKQSDAVVRYMGMPTTETITIAYKY